MTDERIPCTACGVAILPATAAKNGSLCMPCKGGYRATLGEAKAAYEKHRQHRDTAQYRHWKWLVDQVCRTEDGFQQLSLPNRLYFAVSVVSGEVYNGGFDQYFRNSAADHYPVAIEGLTTIGATTSLELLHSAKRLMFGDAEVPATQRQRHAMLGAIGKAAWKSISAELERLDRAFWEEPDELAHRIDRFAEEYGLHRDS